MHSFKTLLIQFWQLFLKVKNMENADLVKRIRQPKMLLNIIAGSAAVIGCFGMFSSNTVIKNFSVVLTITAGIELALGERVAKLYSDAALDAFSSDLEKRKNDIASVERRLSELETENESWKLRDSELELALQTLEAERDAAQGEFQHEKQSKLLMELAMGEAAATAKSALARLEACNKDNSHAARATAVEWQTNAHSGNFPMGQHFRGCSEWFGESKG
jgi:hypothetical protein